MPDSQFNTDTTTLVVVNMQNKFVHPDGTHSTSPRVDLVEPIRELVETYRKTNRDIIFMRDFHTDGNYAHKTTHASPGERSPGGDMAWAEQFHSELTPTTETDYIIDRASHGAFYDSALDTYLSENDITTLHIVGVFSEHSIPQTLSSAGLREYTPVLITDVIEYLTHTPITHANLPPRISFVSQQHSTKYNNSVSPSRPLNQQKNPVAHVR